MDGILNNKGNIRGIHINPNGDISFKKITYFYVSNKIC